MTREEKRQFIEDLTESIKRSMLDDLDRIPDNWDGHELRQWLIDRTNIGAGSLRRDSRRMRDYKNEYIVRCL